MEDGRPARHATGHCPTGEDARPPSLLHGYRYRGGLRDRAAGGRHRDGVVARRRAAGLRRMLLLLPPPHPMPAAKNTSSIRPNPAIWRRRRPEGTPRKKMPASSVPPLAGNQPKPCGRELKLDCPDTTWGATVEMVKVAVALVVVLSSVTGVVDPNEQVMVVVVAGGVQVRSTEPLNPFVPFTVMVDVPGLSWRGDGDCGGSDGKTRRRHKAGPRGHQHIGIERTQSRNQIVAGAGAKAELCGTGAGALCRRRPRRRSPRGAGHDVVAGRNVVKCSGRRCCQSVKRGVDVAQATRTEWPGSGSLQCRRRSARPPRCRLRRSGFRCRRGIH